MKNADSKRFIIYQPGPSPEIKSVGEQRLAKGAPVNGKMRITPAKGNSVDVDVPEERETRTYMLSAKVEDGFIQFYFKDRPTRPDYSGDGPLDVRVVNCCDIRFLLDPDLNWSFRHDFINPTDNMENDAITMGGGVCPTTYYNLRHISEREIIFSATLQSPKEVVVIPSPFPYPPSVQILDRLPDEFNIFVELEQMAAEMISSAKARYPKRLKLRIDPDIQNPGDNTHPPHSVLELLQTGLLDEVLRDVLLAKAK